MIERFLICILRVGRNSMLVNATTDLLFANYYWLSRFFFCLLNIRYVCHLIFKLCMISFFFFLFQIFILRGKRMDRYKLYYSRFLMMIYMVNFSTYIPNKYATSFALSMK